MELRNLITFQLAAEYLNFTKVAKELNFSQPTITAQIKQLEQELGQPLFTHVGKKTYLSPAGKLLKEHTDVILQEVKEMENDFKNYNQLGGHLYIAGYETFCTDIFPSVLSRYFTYHANMDIKLCSNSRQMVINGIMSNKYDMGIISGSYDHPDVECCYLSEEKLEFVVSRKLLETYTQEELFEKYPLIEYRVDEHYSEMTDLFLEKHGMKPGKVIEFGSIPALRKALMNQLGIGIVSRLSVIADVKKGNLEYLKKEKDVNVGVYSTLILLKEKCQWGAVKEFVDILKEVWKEKR